MPSKPAFGMAAIRHAVEGRAADSSLHSTAAEIGMSYTGLRHFLKGGTPHPRTRDKLVEWYTASRSKTEGVEVAPSDLDAALAVVSRYLKAEGRESLRSARIREIQIRLFGSDA